MSKELSVIASDALPGAHEAGHQSPVLFHGVVTPNTSLSASGRRLLIAGIICAATITCSACASAGAWPVSVFVALYAAGAIGALMLFVTGQDRSEDIMLTPGLLTVRRYKRSVLIREIEMPQFGLILETHRDPDYGTLSLKLRRGSQIVEIARDLSPHEREEFRSALVAAFARTTSPPRLLTMQGLPLAPSASLPSAPLTREPSHASLSLLRDQDRVPVGRCHSALRLWVMARGGQGNLAQKLMRWRVGAQFVAIVIAMACLALRHPPG